MFSESFLKRTRYVLLGVLLCTALSTQGVMLFGRSILFQPDSGNYMAYAATLAESFDFSSISLLRTPGYPLVLAGVFKVFGDNSTFGLKLLQHVFNLATLGFLFLALRQLYRPFWFAWCGTFVASFAFQLFSYASLPMTEVTYAMLATGILFFTMAHARSGRSSFFIASCMTIGIAALVRPQGQYLIVLPLLSWLAWRFFPARMSAASSDANQTPTPPLEARYEPRPTRALLSFIVGMVLYLSFVTPWMVRNYIKYDTFSLGGMMGQNLFSRLVEYDGLIAEESSTIQAIQQAYAQYVAQLKAEGKPVNENYTWRNHWPTTTAYMTIHGTDLKETDAVLMRAAKDTLAIYPYKYIENTFIGVYKSLLSYEPIFLYAPGGKRPYSWPDNFMWDIHDINKQYEKKDWAAAKYLDVYEEKNAFTDIYTSMMRIYYPLTAFHKYSLPVLHWQLFGFACCVLWLCLGRNRPATFIYVAFLLYGLVLPMLVVPWAPRHRLPMDPALAALYFYPLILFLEAVWPRVKHLPGRLRQRNAA